MKFIISILLTALLSFAAGLFFPWWIIAIVAFIVAIFIHQSAFKAFLSAFIALFLLWGFQSFMIDAKNEHILSKKVASILPLGGSYIAVILLTAFIGAIVAGLAAMTGSFARSGKR